MNTIEHDLDFNIDMLSLHKMLFIYNAVNNGWSVKKVSDNSFEFIKNKDKVKKEIYLDKFSGKDGRIPATFELITLTAWVPGPGQPKPLKRGSAKNLLKDALDH